MQEEEKIPVDIMTQSFFNNRKAEFESRLVGSVNQMNHGLVRSRPHSPAGVFSQVDMVQDSELHELGMNGVYDDDVPSPSYPAPGVANDLKHPSRHELAQTPDDQDSQEHEDCEGQFDPEVVHVQSLNLPKYRHAGRVDSKVAPMA